MVAACLRSPLYAIRFHEGFGRLYTAEYRPVDGVARYHWPHRTMEHSLDKVDTESIQLRLAAPSGPRDQRHEPDRGTADRSR